MEEIRKGILILESIPDDSVARKVREFLRKHATNLSEDQIEYILKNAPIVLSKQMPEDLGKRWVYFLNVLGASAKFIENGHQGKNLAKEIPSTEKKKPKVLVLQRRHQEKESPPEESPSESPPVEKASQPQKQALPKEESSEVSEDFEPIVFSPAESSEIPPYEREPGHWRQVLVKQLMEVNKELWIVLTLVSLAALLNYAVASKYMLLGFYTIPTVLSAYFFGRRHAVLTAFLSILIVGILLRLKTPIFDDNQGVQGEWLHFTAWSGSLLILAYLMGSLYEKYIEKIKELRRTYQGIIMILRHFISQDKYTENHCYRVSVYAAKIATYMGLDEQMIEDIRVAGLLHDIGKLKISREILYKAAKLSEQEYQEIKKHVSYAGEILEPLQGPLSRVIPIILAHHDKFDGSGYHPRKRDEIVLGARILAVADVYDALTSDRPYRKAMSPFEAKEIIVKGANKDFDPLVVKAFVKAFEAGEMDVPHIII